MVDSRTAQDDVAFDAARNARWNLTVNLLSNVFFSLALSFVFGSTVLTLYASHLTQSALLIGLVPTIQNLMTVVPQLLMSRQTERLPVKKRLFAKVNILERVPYLWIGLIMLLFPNMPPMASYLILVLSLVLAWTGSGVGAPAWKAMLSKVIPANRRGMLFGVSNALGSLLGIGAAWLSRYLLATQVYPRTFAYNFLLCFVCQAISYGLIMLTREPACKPEGKDVSAAEYWRQLPRVLKANRNFLRYLVARALIVMGSMASVYYVIYAQARFDVPDTFASELTMAALITQAVAMPLLGVISDRKGLKWLLELAPVLQLVAVVIVLATAEQAWLYGVFALMYSATAIMNIIGIGMVMEFSAPEDVPTFAALESTIIAVPTLLAPLVGGWLVDHVRLQTAIGAASAAVSGYQVMFLVAAAFGLSGFIVLRWFVKNPRHEAPAAGITAAE